MEKEAVVEMFVNRKLKYVEYVGDGDTNSFASCSKGLTQNQNEAINNIVWSKCSKRVFIVRERFKLAVCEAITSFNGGTRSRKILLDKLKVVCAQGSKKVLAMQNKVRLQNASIKITEKYRKQRQTLRQIRKGKKAGDVCYISCGFSNKLVADRLSVDSNVDFNIPTAPVKVTFVHDDDIPDKIVKYLCTEN